MSAPDVRVFETVRALTDEAAETVATAADRAIRSTGRFVVALSGGSTPAALYARLATPPYSARIDWSRVHVFFGDERCVPPDDPASNYRMAREHLLDQVPIPASQVHRIHGEDDPTPAAAAYERELRTELATADGPPRTAPGARFDLVLLGLGPDGHTASLFPGSAAAREHQRWVIAHRVAGAPGAPWRITITRPVIEAAAEVTFLVAGGEKAAMLLRVLEGPYEPDVLPAQAIAPSTTRVRWLVDAAAAAELRRR